MSNSPEKKDLPGQISLLGTASTMGLHLVSGPVVGGGLGWLVDKGLDSWPVGAAIGLALGLAAGFRNVWADARYLARSNEEADARARARAAQAAAVRTAEGKTSARASIVPDENKVDQGEKAPLSASEEHLLEELLKEDDEEMASMLASLQAGTITPWKKDALPEDSCSGVAGSSGDGNRGSTSSEAASVRRDDKDDVYPKREE